MTGSEPPTQTLKREAFAWVARLTSGEATAADAAALDRWRATSLAHRKAFAEAKLLWKVMRPAAALAVDQAEPMLAGVAIGRAHRQVRRRAVMGGMAAAAAASVAYLTVRPPLDLWPTVAELGSDYRTDTGEQRQITLASHVSVELNTRTSIALRSDVHEADRIELISGEAAIATGSSLARPLVVIAGDGRTTTHAARFNIRYLAAAACITCLEGDVLVERRGASATLQAQQQVTYDAGGLGRTVGTDAAVVTAWQQGLLVFRHTPLAQVIAEVNRYRRGRIILLNEDLGRRLVFASFRIDRIDEVVPRLQAVFDMRVRIYPAGIVLLG